ncbi:MAG: DUF6338 family protein [Treponema sp.]|jgi:ABC-type sugar transport system permease subunit|nr:DUF6338 family protein [Treponema sp.]
MPIVTTELIALLSFLLPGFITSFLFYSLTSFPKKSEFESVIIALIYTVVINALVEAFGIIFNIVGNHFVIGEWNQLSKIICSVVVAVCMGILWSFLYNNDIIHKLLRRLRITSQSSYPSEWYGTFSETKRYIILDLKDERRIMGWPVEWPNYSDKGHFVLEDASWLIGNKGEKYPLKTIDRIMIDTNNVEMVEFMKDECKSGGNQDES